MGQQLHALGLADTPTIDAQSSAARQLMDMYEVMGNVLSRQVACRVRVKPRSALLPLDISLAPAQCADAQSSEYLRTC